MTLPVKLFFLLLVLWTAQAFVFPVSKSESSRSIHASLILSSTTTSGRHGSVGLTKKTLFQKDPIRKESQNDQSRPQLFQKLNSCAGFLWRRVLVSIFFLLFSGRAASAAQASTTPLFFSSSSSLFTPVVGLWRRRRIIARVFSFLTLVKLVWDRILVRRRQRVDPTSEWERYAQYPGARGRALVSLLFLQILPLYSISRLLRAEKLMAYAGNVLTEGLLQLGPLYCKVGQILSCQEKSIPTSWIKSLEKLQDQIPAQTGEKAMKLALSAWEQGRRNNTTLPSFQEIFKDFNTIPLAAASLGQVHKAVLRATNETVAIKLQRPFLRQIYDQDLTFLTTIAKSVDRFAGKAGKVGGVEQSWEEIFLDAETILYREIDYRAEAENGLRFCRDFGLDKNGKKATPTAKSNDGKLLPSAASWLRAPHVYDDLSSEQVLVMEFVPSIKITNTAKLNEAGVTADEKEYLADCLGRAYLRQFCSHRFFSTDPHPGNLGCEIREMKNKTSTGTKKYPTKDEASTKRVRLVFYDFGQAAELTQGQADGILEIIEAIVDMDVEKSMDAFSQMGVLKPDADLDKVRAKVADNYRTGKVKANRKRLSKRGYKLSDVTKSTNSTGNSTKATDPKVRDAEVMQYFTLPAEYAFVGRALSQMAGVGKTLDEDFDFISSAAPWIYEIKGAGKYLRDEISKRLEKWGLLDIMPTYVDSPPPAGAKKKEVNKI